MTGFVVGAEEGVICALVRYAGVTAGLMEYAVDRCRVQIIDHVTLEKGTTIYTF